MKSLTKVKERPGMLNVKGVVYSIPCANCPATYIGETGRTLKVHMAEHKRAVKSKDPLNGIAVHIQKTAHNINWQEARRILAWENNCACVLCGMCLCMCVCCMCVVCVMYDIVYMCMCVCMLHVCCMCYV